MDVLVAEAILEFGDDLRQAVAVATSVRTQGSHHRTRG